MRSEPTTASQSDNMTEFHFNPAKSTWTLLAAAVVWTATNVFSGIKATTGRNFPSFELPTQGQRPPACFNAFIAWHVLIVAFVHKIARLTAWARTQVMHSISCDVGYAAFLAGMPYIFNVPFRFGRAVSVSLSAFSHFGSIIRCGWHSPWRRRRRSTCPEDARSRTCNWIEAGADCARHTEAA